MAFTPATIDPSAFAPVDLASMYAADQQKQANDLILQEKRDRLAARQRWNELTSSPDADLNNPAFVQRLMAVDPDQAKAVLDAQQSRQKYQYDMATKRKEASIGAAGALFKAFGSLPPEQRTDEAKRQVVMNYVQAIEPHDPEFSGLINPNDPETIRHIETIARANGGMYPEEQQAEEQRKAVQEVENKMLLKERENQLPLSLAERQKLDVEKEQKWLTEQGTNRRELSRNETDLRKEYNSEIKPIKDFQGGLHNAANLVKLGKTNPQAAFGAIQQMQKTFDQQGVVRTEDIENMVNRQPVDDRIKSGIQRLMTGGTLPDAMAADFNEILATYSQALDEIYKLKRTQYETIAKNQGLNLENIFEPHAAPSAAPVQPAAPAGQALAPQGQSLNAADVPFDVPIRSPRTGQMVIKRRASNGEIKWEPAP